MGPKNGKGEFPANLTDADILDTVRRLRAYLSALDNTKHLLDNITYMGDKVISDVVLDTVPKINDAAKSVAKALKTIESGRAYKNMTANFRMETSDDESND